MDWRMNSNVRRIFESVVSVEAWHTEFSSKDRTAAVHVDVSFLKGRLGDEPESPVRFEITLRRAEIVFLIPENEPLGVVQDSVHREAPQSVTTAVSRYLESRAAAQGKISSDVLHGKGAFNAEAERSLSTSQRQEIKKDSGEIIWAQSRTGDGDYRWEVGPAVGPVLLGKVWDAVTEPLLKIRSKSPPHALLDAVCRIEIKCRREDVAIEQIQLKSGKAWKNIVAGTKRKAAAEAYIKNALASRNLDVLNFDDPYGHIMLADVIVEAPQ